MRRNNVAMVGIYFVVNSFPSENTLSTLGWFHCIFLADSWSHRAKFQVGSSSLVWGRKEWSAMFAAPAAVLQTNSSPRWTSAQGFLRHRTPFQWFCVRWFVHNFEPHPHVLSVFSSLQFVFLCLPASWSYRFYCFSRRVNV